MDYRYVLSATACAVLAACGGTPETGPDAEPPAPESEAAAPAGGTQAGTDPATEGDMIVQPEWDALDRTTDSCGMAAVRGFLGEAASDIPEDRLPEEYRILAPSDQATMDYRPMRLNVLTNEEGTVIGFKCG